ncbi:hypothetical protein MWU61_18370 [Loktanella sp. F6476L]|uniref:hypothetical protein n=1 Tax=Loktanella sp. F6476L TaxID=2926405 RepID=UPI001FF3CF78|nr:hypothetical protein [Loktanella sp. F6476L]MCK0122525.1 hypothetical protein [Loktanella sp. F6476L]
MDYVDLLKEQCPPAIVEYVTGTNMTTFGTEPWPNKDYVGSAVSDPCHIAALLYRSSILPNDVFLSFADYIVRDTGAYFDKIEEKDRPVLVAAMRQMATRDSFPQGFFSTITRHQIDVEDVLAQRFLTLPSAENATPGPNFEAFAYLRYKAAMGDPDALLLLIDALRLEPSPSYVLTELNQIRNLRMPQTDTIYQAFINDTRQSVSPIRVPGIVIANTVRRHLGLPKHEGPYQPLEHDGQPFQP